MSEPREQVEERIWRRLARAWRRGLAKLSLYTNRSGHKARQYWARFGNVVAAAFVAILVAASAYPLPSLQRLLETRFATEEGVQRVQSLLLNTGSALIGAAAIVTSLVLFAMQVNVERMPHGLFRRLSEDRKLLGAFASAFVLAISVAAMSTVAEQTTLAAVLLSAGWAILFILALFLYAYRRALRLINPLEQLQILLDDTRKDLRRWARRAERTRPLLESNEPTEVEPPARGPKPDTERTVFFQLNPHWIAEARRSVQHAVSFARRYAEQGDYEVAGGALTAIVGINAAYVEAKGKTFYANNLLMPHPLASDAFITETLEYMRQNVDRGSRVVTSDKSSSQCKLSQRWWRCISTSTTPFKPRRRVMRTWPRDISGTLYRRLLLTT